MKKPSTRLWTIVAVASVATAIGAITAADVQAQGRNPLDQLLSIAADVRAEIMDSTHGLAAIEREVRAIQDAVAPTQTVRLSTGPFMVPPSAGWLEWVVANNASTPQTVTMTVFRHGIGMPRSVVPISSFTFTIAAAETTHETGPVGWDGPIYPQNFYEVQIEKSDPRVLASVDLLGVDETQPIIGTLIPPGVWVRVP